MGAGTWAAGGGAWVAGAGIFDLAPFLGGIVVVACFVDFS